MSKNISILDYGIGNVRSLHNSLAYNKLNSIITDKEDKVLESQMLIVPGVGSFKGCMDAIKKRNLHKLIYAFAKTGKKLVGICVGMQILFDHGYEFKKTKGLGLIKGEVRRIDYKSKKNILLPHIGWNSLIVKKKNNIIESSKKSFYFIHSFSCIPVDKKVILSTTKYENIEFTSAIQKSNIYGFQFHPEKSSNEGLNLLRKLYEVNE